MRALIVDDEQPNLEGLRLQLMTYCPEVKEISVAQSARVARERIAENPIDILFLDINMPNENGFDLLASLHERKFSVVFVTAYSDFAVRAFKANAIDYLLKPVDNDELIEAVQRCVLRKSPELHYENLRSALDPNAWPTKLTLPHQQGFHIIETADIIWIAADGNYCLIHLADGKSMLVTKAIREFEMMLNPAEFFRSHKSSLIHLRYVKEYSSADGHYAHMLNGQRAPISRRKLEEFMGIIDAFSKRM